MSETTNEADAATNYAGRVLAVGDVVIFKAYGNLEEGQEPTLVAGAEVRVIRVQEDGGATVEPVAGGDGDTVFPDEITWPDGSEVLDPVAQAQEAAKATAPVKAGRKAGKPKASEEDKAAAKAAAKAAKDAAAAEAKATAAATKAAEKAAAAATKAQEKASAKEAKGTLAPVVAPAAVTVVDTAAVNRLLDESDALTAAKSLVLQTERAYFSLGGVLNHIYDHGVFKTAGFDGKRGFADYVEQELGLKYRTAMYLIRIYKAFRALGVDESRLAAIGWSKAKELTEVVTPENYEELIDIAASKSREDLIAYVKETFESAEDGGGTGTGGTRVKKTKFQFALFEDQAATVVRGLEVAKSLANTEDLSQALEYIVAEWLQTAEGVQPTLEDSIALLQSRFNVTLLIDDSPAGEVVQEA